MRAWQILRAGWRAYRTWPNGAVLRAEIQAIGGIWPKVGQLLSLRRDILPAAVCEALTPLQGEQTTTGIRASIGYVVREGDKAIKRIRPDVAALVGQDLAIIRALARSRTLRLIPVVRRMRLREFVAELDQVMHEELDFRYEAARQHELRKKIRRHKGLYVPKVYAAECTADRLVTEWIDGVILGDVLALSGRALTRALDRLALTAKQIAKRLLFSQLRQIFEDNLFHGDAHPRNILLRRKEIVLIDFGTVGSTAGDFLARFLEFVTLLTTRHFEAASQVFALLCQGLQPRLNLPWWPNRRLIRLEARLARAMALWADRTLITTLPYAVRSMNALTDAMMREVMQAKGALAWAWFRIQRAIATLDGTLMIFWPALNFLKVATQYLRDAERRVKPRKYSKAALQNRALDLFNRLDGWARITTADTRFEGLLKGWV